MQLKLSFNFFKRTKIQPILLNNSKTNSKLPHKTNNSNVSNSSKINGNYKKRKTIKPVITNFSSNNTESLSHTVGSSSSVNDTNKTDGETSESDKEIESFKEGGSDKEGENESDKIELNEDIEEGSQINEDIIDANEGEKLENSSQGEEDTIEVPDIQIEEDDEDDELNDSIKLAAQIHSGDYDDKIIACIQFKKIDLRQLTSGVSSGYVNSIFHRVAELCGISGDDDAAAFMIYRNLVYNRFGIRDKFTAERANLTELTGDEAKKCRMPVKKIRIPIHPPPLVKPPVKVA